MTKIKDMSIRELEKILNIWNILKKFYFTISLILLIGIGFKFVILKTNIYDLFFLIVALYMVYIPIFVEIHIKLRIDKKIFDRYAKKDNTNKKR